MERLTDHENEHYNQPGCNSCSDYRWRSCKESGEIDDCIQRLTWLRLLDIEDILGDDYDLDRLRELVKADREGRCVVLPCKPGKTVYKITVSLCKWRDVDKCHAYCDGYGDCWEGERIVIAVPFEVRMLNDIGKLVFLTRESAEAALKGEQA